MPLSTLEATVEAVVKEQARREARAQAAMTLAVNVGYHGKKSDVQNALKRLTEAID